MVKTPTLPQHNLMSTLSIGWFDLDMTFNNQHPPYPCIHPTQQETLFGEIKYSVSYPNPRQQFLFIIDKYLRKS